MHPLVLQLQGELRGAWRFRWIALATAWGVALVGWFTIAFLPNQYEAQARIFVDTQSVLKPLLQGLAVETDVMTKVNMISRALLSRPQLERVARETGLSLRAVTESEQQALMETLSENIEIRQTQMANLFTITYRDTDRAMSQRVVQELLDSLVEDTLGVNRSDSTNAQRFLTDQIGDYEKRLTEAENRLADFKKRNVGSMPDERGGYYTRLQAAMNEQERLTTQLQVAQSRHSELQKQLSGEEPTLGLMNRYEESSGVSATDEALSRLREERERLLVRFTDQHPEVIAVNETIANLEERRKSEERSAAMSARDSSLSRNPVYQDLRIAFNQAALQVTTLRGQLAQAQEEAASLRRAINVIPEVEAELARLNRDYEVTKTQYESLVQRLESARISQDAEQSNDEIKFRIIDPAVASLQPVAPKRGLLQSATLGFALFVGIALAVGLHMLSPVFVSRQGLTELTGLPVIGVISECRTPEENALERRHMLLLAGGAAGLVLMFAAVLVFQEPAVRLLGSLVRGGGA